MNEDECAVDSKKSGWPQIIKKAVMEDTEISSCTLPLDASRWTLAAGRWALGGRMKLLCKNSSHAVVPKT
jgi:hypothetical protein